MKKFLLLLLLMPSIVFAQKVMKHTVVAKESYSSIGRLYDINGRELADFNSLDYNVGLSIGQVINVPMKGNGTIPKSKPTAPVEQTNQPIYHTLKQGESLYQLSRMYPPTTVDNLRTWNNLSSDNLILGSKLIVGYGKGTSTQNKISPDETPAPTTKIQAEEPSSKQQEKEQRAEAKRIANEQKKLDEEAAKNRKQQAELEEKRIEDEQKAMQKKAKETAQKRQISSTEGVGFFKKDFTGNEGNLNSGKAGVFKSTSGWEDEKFYALFDDARPGTILKVTNKETGKVVYVKVLDIIPKLNENKSLILRLSNAAASALGAEASEFNCDIEF